MPVTMFAVALHCSRVAEVSEQRKTFVRGCSTALTKGTIALSNVLGSGPVTRRVVMERTMKAARNHLEPTVYVDAVPELVAKRARQKDEQRTRRADTHEASPEEASRPVDAAA
jgi:hypothetical protein